jgi:hypothetical protein
MTPMYNYLNILCRCPTHMIFLSIPKSVQVVLREVLVVGYLSLLNYDSEKTHVTFSKLEKGDTNVFRVSYYN